MNCLFVCLFVCYYYFKINGRKQTQMLHTVRTKNMTGEGLDDARVRKCN